MSLKGSMQGVQGKGHRAQGTGHRAGSKEQGADKGCSVQCYEKTAFPYFSRRGGRSKMLVCFVK